jgi:hypothetical protein
VAATCIVGAVHCPAGHREAMSREGAGHGADLLILGDLDRQAELDGRIAKHRRPSGSTITRRAPDHILVDPHQQRPPLAPRCVGAGRVRRAISGGRWLAPAACLTAWIHKVNPTRQSSATTLPLRFASAIIAIPVCLVLLPS